MEVLKYVPSYFSYFIYMRLDINESISFAQKNKNKIKKERKKFSVRFGKCSVFFTSNDPLTLSLICICIM